MKTNMVKLPVPIHSRLLDQNPFSVSPEPHWTFQGREEVPLPEGLQG